MTQNPAIRVVMNGRIYTGDPGRETVEAFAMTPAGEIVSVGASSVMTDQFPKADVIDLEGRCVIPGLTDVHTHVARHALDIRTVECRDTVDPAVDSIAQIMSRMAAAAVGARPGDYVIGTGAMRQANRLAEGRWPSRAEFDAAVPANPAYITFGSHLTLANSTALAQAGITADAPDPANGRIGRDPDTGEPDGILYEGAGHLVFRRLSDMYGFDALVDSLEASLRQCAARGVTCIHDMIKTRAEMRAFQVLRDNGRLPIRTSLLMWQLNDNAEFGPDDMPTVGIQTGLGDDWLWYGGIKIAFDGGFTGHSAAFSATIDGRSLFPDPVFFFDRDTLNHVIALNHRAGIRVQVHAIGDFAVDCALEAFGRAGTAGSGVRHRIEHFGNWLCTPKRLAEARRLGVTPVPNPPFLYYLGADTYKMLGGDRHYAPTAFPFRTLVGEGFHVSGASDGPGYYTVDGLRDLSIMIGRQSMDGVYFGTEENLTFQQALTAQTLNGAWLGYREKTLGSLAPGKHADFLILDCDDIGQLSPEEIRSLAIHQTVIAGQPVATG